MISGFIVKSKIKFILYRPTRAWKGSRGIALLFLDLSAKRGVGSQHLAPAALPPRKTRYPLYRMWVGPRAGLDVCEKSRPHRDWVPGPSSPWSVAKPTELPGPPSFIGVTLFCIYSICIVLWIFRYSKHSNSIKDIQNKIYVVFSYIKKILLVVYSMRVGRLYVVMLQNGLVYLSFLRLM
jgi:hypothetical protein